MGIGVMYTVVIHWALIQLQGGMWDITMLTVHERIYAILSLALAAFIMALGIASIAHILHHSIDVANDRASQRLMLRAFANRHKLPKELEHGVMQVIQYTRRMRELRAQDTSLLSVLPEGLRKDIMLHVTGEVLMQHPLFKFLRCRNVHFIRDLCLVMASEDFMTDDVLFVPGDSCSAVRFFSAGYLRYYHASELQGIHGERLLGHEFSTGSSVYDRQVSSLPIGPGEWLSEA